jgi:phosphoribosylanthranilate isomerase
MNDREYPQIKICGLTVPDQAKACVDLGADAIGLVFYPKSPRNVSVKQAADITSALPRHVATVGVFVNPDLAFLHQTIEQCGLSVAQLHGNETPDFVTELRDATQVRIIKALFAEKPPDLNDAPKYDVDGYLVECGKGRLPGGNAMTWNWAIAEKFARSYPLVLAGGLTPENVTQAIQACLPDSVDASSGLESGPGHKDLGKVKAFIEQVRRTRPMYIHHKHKIRSILTTS